MWASHKQIDWKLAKKGRNATAQMQKNVGTSSLDWTLQAAQSKKTFIDSN